MRPATLSPSPRTIRMQLRIPPILTQHPSLPPILQKNIQDLPKLRLRLPIENRRHHLHSFGQIPIHPIGRPDEELALQRIVMSRREMKDARMLQIAPDDRPDSDA